MKRCCLFSWYKRRRFFDLMDIKSLFFAALKYFFLIDKAWGNVVQYYADIKPLAARCGRDTYVMVKKIILERIQNVCF